MNTINPVDAARIELLLDVSIMPRSLKFPFDQSTEAIRLFGIKPMVLFDGPFKWRPGIQTVKKACTARKFGPSRQTDYAAARAQINLRTNDRRKQGSAQEKMALK